MTDRVVRRRSEPVSGTQTVERDKDDGLAMAVVTRGKVGDDVVDYARKRLATVIDKIADPVLLIRVKLSLAGDPGRQRPAIAQVTLDVDGEVIRAHVAAGQLREAIDLLQRRLRDKVEHRATVREARRRSTGRPTPGEWRHGDLRPHRASYFDRPPEDRQLVAHKSFAGGDLTPDEAAFDMDQLDYDFYLFRDVASDQDAVLARAADGAFVLRLLEPVDVGARATAIRLDEVRQAAPRLTVAEAVELLDASIEPFVFFAEADTGRGNVVYRRYDGHYGLLTLE